MPANKTAAAKTEALGRGTQVRFEDHTYTIAPAEEWDVEAIEAAEAGQLATACRLLLGDDQWAAFKSKKRTLSDLAALFEAVQSAFGIEGN